MWKIKLPEKNEKLFKNNVFKWAGNRNFLYGWFEVYKRKNCILSDKSNSKDN